MDDRQVLTQVIAFHAEWCQRPVNRRRRGLKMALYRERLELFRLLQRKPSLLEQLPLAVMEQWEPVKGKLIGEKTIQKEMDRLVIVFRAERERGYVATFDEFVRAVLQQCRTARDLERFLAIRSFGRS